MLTEYATKMIVNHINNNYSRNTTYLAIYKELAIKYNVSINTIKSVHQKAIYYKKLKEYHNKMEELIAIKVSQNPFNLEKCFRELSCEHNETFKYFHNRYYRYVKFNKKLFYIEHGGIKLYNVKQIKH